MCTTVCQGCRPRGSTRTPASLESSAEAPVKETARGRLLGQLRLCFPAPSHAELSSAVFTAWPAWARRGVLVLKGQAPPGSLCPKHNGFQTALLRHARPSVPRILGAWWGRWGNPKCLCSSAASFVYVTAEKHLPLAYVSLPCRKLLKFSKRKNYLKILL